jgi:HSP20 family molecular chaperone IbpA
MAKDQELQTAEKKELSTDAEQTRQGAVYQPAVDIFETGNGITLLADMPGVAADQLTIDLRDGVLTIRGDVPSPVEEGESAVLEEFGWGSYYRQFTLADSVDQEKIEARLNNGVLRLELPKVEKAKPRKIAVKTA